MSTRYNKHPEGALCAMGGYQLLLRDGYVNNSHRKVYRQ